MLREAELTGRRATIEILVDPALTLMKEGEVILGGGPLALEVLTLPNITETKVRLEQLQYLMERVMPKLTYLEVAAYEEDATAWLSEHHPQVGNYISDTLF